MASTSLLVLAGAGEWSLGGLGGGGVEMAILMFARGGGGSGPAVA